MERGRRRRLAFIVLSCAALLAAIAGIRPRRERMALALMTRSNIVDPHFSRNMTCLDCHSASEVHGVKFKLDGSPYISFWEPGFFDASCEKCHVEGTAPRPPQNVAEHQVHVYALRNVACEARHTATVQTCYSCHLDGSLRGIPHA
ncbi:MAG: hypothetical protein QXU97_05865 [Fervidicoccaceae archaeon]